MKIEKKEATFEPVVITLQTQGELDLFLEVFYRVGGSVVRDILGSTSTMPDSLRKAGAVHRDEWIIDREIYIEHQ